jgi:hypothetical protein
VTKKLKFYMFTYLSMLSSKDLGNNIDTFIGSKEGQDG